MRGQIRFPSAHHLPLTLRARMLPSGPDELLQEATPGLPRTPIRAQRLTLVGLDGSDEPPRPDGRGQSRPSLPSRPLPCRISPVDPGLSLSASRLYCDSRHQEEFLALLAFSSLGAPRTSLARDSARPPCGGFLRRGSRTGARGQDQSSRGCEGKACPEPGEEDDAPGRSRYAVIRLELHADAGEK